MSTQAIMAQTAEIAAQNCKLNTPPPNETAQGFGQANAMLNSLGLNKCQTTTTSTPVNIGVDTSSAGLALFQKSESTVVTGTALATYTVDCQKVAVIAQAYDKAVEDVKCIIQNSATSSSITTVHDATIKLTFSKDSHTVLNCPQGVNIENKITGKTIIYNHIHQATKTQITDAIISHIEPAIQALKLKSGTDGPQGQGSQSFNAIISQLYSGTLAQQISTSIDNACTTEREGTVIDLKFDGWMYMDTLEQCNFTNDIHVDIIATNAVQTAFQAAFKNQNVPSLLPLPPSSSAPASSNTTLYVIIGVIVFLLILGGAYYYYFVYEKKKTAAVQKAFKFEMCPY